MAIALAGASASEFTRDLVAIFDACRVGPVFRAYSKEAEILDVLDLALAASSVDAFGEVAVEAKIDDSEGAQHGQEGLAACD